MLLTSFSRTDSVVQFLTLLIIFLFIIAVTYFTVRWMSRIQQGQSKYTNIEVIETRGIANNKYLQIVKAGGKYLLIGVGKDEINVLTELDEDKLNLKDYSEGSAMSFSSFLDKAKSLTRKDEKERDKE
ncbi:MAG: flagellar biosynthetic protein FliO [Lachnospiraceae bacterium]|nr:flagellar biosynthetic protein FliO [Lachnospiraceae bacterium]